MGDWGRLPGQKHHLVKIRVAGSNDWIRWLVVSVPAAGRPFVKSLGERRHPYPARCCSLANLGWARCESRSWEWATWVGPSPPEQSKRVTRRRSGIAGQVGLAASWPAERSRPILRRPRRRVLTPFSSCSPTTQPSSTYAWATRCVGIAEPDAVFANVSTVSPKTARRLAEVGPEGRVLDAPVMGSPSMIAGGLGRFLVGGPALSDYGHRSAVERPWVRLYLLWAGRSRGDDEGLGQLVVDYGGGFACRGDRHGQATENPRRTPAGPSLPTAP